jgi:hypothetical protein
MGGLKQSCELRAWYGIHGSGLVYFDLTLLLGVSSLGFDSVPSILDTSLPYLHYLTNSFLPTLGPCLGKYLPNYLCEVHLIESYFVLLTSHQTVDE